MRSYCWGIQLLTSRWTICEKKFSVGCPGMNCDFFFGLTVVRPGLPFSTNFHWPFARILALILPSNCFESPMLSQRALVRFTAPSLASTAAACHSGDPVVDMRDKSHARSLPLPHPISRHEKASCDADGLRDLSNSSSIEPMLCSSIEHGLNMSQVSSCTLASANPSVSRSFHSRSLFTKSPSQNTHGHIQPLSCSHWLDPWPFMGSIIANGVSFAGSSEHRCSRVASGILVEGSMRWAW